MYSDIQALAASLISNTNAPLLFNTSCALTVTSLIKKFFDYCESSRHCVIRQRVASEIEETRYSIRNGLRNGIWYSIVIPRIVSPHSPFAVCMFIGGIPGAERRFLVTMLNADRRSSRLVSSHCSLPGIIFVNCHDPTAIPRAVGDPVSLSTSEISELSFAPAVSMRDDSRDGIIARHKRDSDKSVSLCDH